MFPDAPTERGLKHLYELCECLNDGYKAFVIFLVKMENINVFTPNKSTHPEFAHGLEYAQNCGVKILCLDCIVTPDTLKANKFIDYIL